MSTAPRRVVLAVAIVALLSTALCAQQQGQRGRFQGGRGFGGGFNPVPGMDKIGLLTNEAVQKELELADDQKADLRKIGEDARTQSQNLFSGFNFREFQNLSEEERAKRREESNKKREALGKELVQKIEAVLLPHQMERLNEISIQVRGTRALRDDDVAQALGLKPDQKEKLEAIPQEVFARNREGGQDGNRERFAEAGKEIEEKSLAVLTAEQKEKFEKMKGKPFDVEAAGLRRGGFGFGFGGQGGPGGRGQGAPGGRGQGRPGGQPRTRGNNN